MVPTCDAEERNCSQQQQHIIIAVGDSHLGDLMSAVKAIADPSSLSINHLTLRSASARGLRKRRRNGPRELAVEFLRAHGAGANVVLLSFGAVDLDYTTFYHHISPSAAPEPIRLVAQKLASEAASSLVNFALRIQKILHEVKGDNTPPGIWLLAPPPPPVEADFLGAMLLPALGADALPKCPAVPLRERTHWHATLRSALVARCKGNRGVGLIDVTPTLLCNSCGTVQKRFRRGSLPYDAHLNEHRCAPIYLRAFQQMICQDPEGPMSILGLAQQARGAIGDGYCSCGEPEFDIAWMVERGVSKYERRVKSAGAKEDKSCGESRRVHESVD